MSSILTRASSKIDKQGLPDRVKIPRVRARYIDLSVLGISGGARPQSRCRIGRIKTEEAVVPSLWWFEIRNIIVVNERGKRITEWDTGVFLRDLTGLRIRVDREPDESAVLRLARTHLLSVHDASYLELALREAIPLATLTPSLPPRHARRVVD